MLKMTATVVAATLLMGFAPAAGIAPVQPPALKQTPASAQSYEQCMIDQGCILITGYWFCPTPDADEICSAGG